MAVGRLPTLLAALALSLAPLACDQASDDDDATGDDDSSGDDDDSSGDDDDSSGDDDTTADSLRILSAVPAVNAVDVPVDGALSVTFTADVDQDTLTADSVLLSTRQAGFLDVALAYDADSRMLTVTPEVNLRPGDRLRLTLTPAVRDTAGEGIVTAVDGDSLQVGTSLGYWATALADEAMLQPGPGWESVEADRTITARYGDVDNDGWLDVAVASGEMEDEDPVRVYYNDHGALGTAAGWTSGPAAIHFGVDLGDVDRDGWLDMATGKRDGETELYVNDGQGSFPSLPGWASTTRFITRSVAFGDVDNDGWLELATANTYADIEEEKHADGFNEVFGNDAGELSGDPVWQSEDDRFSRMVIWADINGDGLDDLCFANMWEGQSVYYNRGGGFPPTADWQSADEDQTRYIAVHDFDRDGWLDLAACNESGYACIYFNLGGELETVPSWESGQYRKAVSVAAGDLDGDGWPDLVFGHAWEHTEPFDGTLNTKTAYLNQGGTFGSEPDWTSANAGNTWGLALGDVDRDGDLDLFAAERNDGDAGAPNTLYLSL